MRLPERFSWADVPSDGSTIPGRKYDDLPQPGVMAQEMALPVNVTTSIRNFVTCIIIEVTNAKMWSFY